MTPPAASVAMLLLGSLIVGLAHRTEAGELWVDVPGAGPQPVPGEVLDELERKGWLDLSGDVPRVTRNGIYWCDKWARTWHRKRVA